LFPSPVNFEKLFKVGIDPDLTLHHPGSRAAAIGIRCGLAVAAMAETDGLNLLGDAGGQKYNRVQVSKYQNSKIK
jgi:hypothetical protein